MNTPPPARRRLLSMGTAYAMGTFNDNFFKQATLLLAAFLGMQETQGLTTLLFALPFVLFSAWAGWLADFLPKKNIALASKFLELAAMLLGLWALLNLHWPALVGVVGLLALQSTLFSPALGGNIPETFPPHQVPKVNALLKTATTLTILLGIALAGVVLEVDSLWPSLAHAVFPHGLPAFLPQADVYGFGRLAVGAVALLAAALGLLAAFGLLKAPAPTGARHPFPLLGPVDSARHAARCHATDKPLFLCLAAEAFFYGFSVFVLLVLNNFGVNQLGFSLTQTSLLSAALMLGICLGALLAGQYSASSWRRLLLPAGSGMAAGTLLAALAPLLPSAPLRLGFLALAFAFVGLCGGLFLIPLVSFIQLQPKPTDKGKTLGISNFASFSSVALAGLAFALFGHATPAFLLVAAAAASFAFLLWARAFLRHLPAPSLADTGIGLLGLCLRTLASLRYSVRVSGLENIPAEEGRPLLFLPNHPALVDSVLIYSSISGLRPRPLADQRQMQGPLGAIAAKVVGAIVIPDLCRDGAKARQGVEAGMHQVVAAMQGGENVLLYPSGKIYRCARERLGGNSGAAHLLAALPNLRVVLVRIQGLWGSSFSYAAHQGPPSFAKALLKGALTLLANGLLFAPRRKICVEFVEHPQLPREGNRRTLNAWLETFYNEAACPPVAVPRFFWQGSTPRPLADYAQTDKESPEARLVAPHLREAVYASLRKAAQLPEQHVLTEDMSLGAELGLDSISLMDLVVELERVHGKPIANLEELVTVGDCLSAVAEESEAGAAGAGGEAPPTPPAIPAAWFAPAPVKTLSRPEGAATVPDSFLAIVRRAPRMPLLADRASMRTRREVLTAALVLAERFKVLPGKRLGIMLPSVPSVGAVWMGALLAGKEPVFFNWTVGEANLRHCMALSGVRYIVSAAALLDKLKRSGLNTEALPATWLRLESLGASIKRWEKLKGFVRARFARSFKHYAVGQVAAVLFTSGSEDRPKAVPLTHNNLLVNAKDIIDVLEVDADEAILAMLPPFHSFGLVVGLVLPLALGLKAAFHPNPTETEPLISLVRDYKLSLLAAPPTFLEALLDKLKSMGAQGKEAFASLRFAFVGAEKCPERVYAAFGEACPQAAMCEGYGITECSPAVAVNRPRAIQLGTLGHAMPAVTTAIVHEEEGHIVGRVATGETGMLLVRGESVFGGYLGEAPNPFVHFEGHTWYRTGDLLSMDETGRLTFRGRLKRFIKLGGEMVSLPQMENILLEAFAGRGGPTQEGPVLALEASPEEAGAEIALFTSLALELAEVNAALRAAGLSALYSVKRLIPVEAIPLLGSGKTDYRALKARLVP